MFEHIGIWGAKANNFREKRKLFSGSWGDQCIIFRDLGSTDPPGGLNIVFNTFFMRFGKNVLLRNDILDLSTIY